MCQWRQAVMADLQGPKWCVIGGQGLASVSHMPSLTVAVLLGSSYVMQKSTGTQLLTRGI